MSDIASSPLSHRAGFWRRAIAFVIDVCLIGLLIAVIGVICFRLTDGKVRLSSGILDVSICSNVDPQSIGVRIPPNFNVSKAVDCPRYFLGLEHDRIVTITETTQSGSVTYNRSFSYPLDLTGHPTDAFYLDFLWLILLPAYILLFESCFARTIGKRIMGLRIASSAGGRIDFIQAVKRLVIRFLPWPLWALSYSATIQQNTMLFVFVAGLSFVASLIVGLNFILATRRRLLPWDDLWAGTEVVRA